MALDDRGRLLLLNPSARAMFGVENGVAEGRSFLEVIRQKGLLDLVEEVRASGAPARHELELGPPVNRVVAARGAPLGLGPESAGVLLVLHDVTELRRLERVRSEFVANVSHELRTPLTCIKGYLETLLDGALDDRAHARRFLEVAGTHAERLDRLIDDLLELSNIESGRVTLAPMRLDLGDVVAGVAAMFERQTAQNRQTLERAVPPGLAVRADRDRLVQILVNLVDNAVKFTPEGGRIRIEAGAGPDGRVDGPGPRHGHRDPVDGSAADHGALLPRGQDPVAGGRRDRARARDREASGPGPRGRASHRERARARHDGELHAARGRRSRRALSADAWGIEDGYIDTGGAWRPTGAEARARIRAAMGATGEAPPPDAGPLVHRRGRPLPAVEGAVELALEDGTLLRVDRGLPPDLPLGYHELRPLDGRPAVPPHRGARRAATSPKGSGPGGGRSSCTRSGPGRAGGSATSPISGGSPSGPRARSGRARSS